MGPPLKDSKGGCVGEQGQFAITQKGT